MPRAQPQPVVPSAATAAARPTAHLPALDGLRGLAVLMVFVFHYGGGLTSSHLAVRLLGQLTQAGWCGVVIFFALSGFLITGGLWDALHAQPRLSTPRLLAHFFARRVLRIFPLYYATLAAAALFTLARGAQFTDLPPYRIYLFFLQDLPQFFQASLHVSPLLPLFHLWSIAVEEQFYLLWPCLLLLAGTRRAALRLCLTVVGISVVFRLIVYGLPQLAFARQQHLFDAFVLTYAGALAMGSGLALLQRSPHAAALLRWAPLLFVAALALYLLTSAVTGSLHLRGPLQYTLGLPAVAAASTALVALLLRPGAARTLLSLQPLPWIGRISYGVYVLHLFFEPVFDALGSALTHTTAGMAYQTARFAAALPLTLLAAWLSYQLLELPFLQAKRHFPLRAPRPQPTPTA